MSVGSPIGFISNYLDTRQALPLEYDNKPLRNHELLMTRARAAREDEFVYAFIINKLNDPAFRTNPRTQLTEWQNNCYDTNFTLHEEHLALEFFKDNIALL